MKKINRNKFLNVLTKSPCEKPINDYNDVKNSKIEQENILNDFEKNISGEKIYNDATGKNEIIATSDIYQAAKNFDKEFKCYEQRIRWKGDSQGRPEEKPCGEASASYCLTQACKEICEALANELKFSNQNEDKGKGKDTGKGKEKSCNTYKYEVAVSTCKTLPNLRLREKAIKKELDKDQISKAMNSIMRQKSIQEFCQTIAEYNCKKIEPTQVIDKCLSDGELCIASSSQKALVFIYFQIFTCLKVSVKKLKDDQLEKATKDYCRATNNNTICKLKDVFCPSKINKNRKKRVKRKIRKLKRKNKNGKRNK